jgi:outer membrane protein
MKKYIIVIILILISGIFSYSQEILTLEQAISTALKNNYGINISKNDLQIAKNNITLGNAGYLPRIDLFGSYNVGTSKVQLKTVTGFDMDKDNAKADILNAGLNARWTLFDGLYMFRNYESLEKSEIISDLDTKLKMENTITLVSSIYFDIIEKEDLVKYWNEQVELSKYRVEIAQVNFDNGIGTELELMKAKVELNFDISDLEKQKAKIEILKAAMNDALSRNINTSFSINDSISLIPKIEYESAKNNMLKSNRSILISEQKRELSEIEAKKAMSKYYPVIDFNFIINYFNINNDAILANINKGYGVFAGLSANLNLFDGGNDSRKVENANINIKNSELRTKELALWFESYLFKVFKEYDVYRQLTDFERGNIELAKKNMDIAKESYAVGAISSLEYREAQKNLLEANTRLINAIYITKTKELEILLITGQILK